jgi:tricorn protease
MPTNIVRLGTIAALACALACASARAQSVSAPAPFQRPTVSRTHVAFAFAGDIWAVSRAGGEARRLTSDPGQETYPVFSPDGSRLAFARLNAASGPQAWDVYVMPAAGGEAARLTYHPDLDVPVGWTPDGKRVLFFTLRDRTWFLDSRLYTVPAAGGPDEPLPLPDGWAGSFSPDATRIAYAPRPDALDIFAWRNYRGGGPSRVWIARLSDSSVEEVPHTDSNDIAPMWGADGRVYFLSDRDGTNNLFVYDTRTRAVAQLTRFRKFDIRAASLGGDAIAFTQGGAIHLYDLKAGQARKLDVRIGGDFAETKPRKVDPWQWANPVNLAPGGDRLLAGARGEVFVADIKGGEVSNLTRTPAAAERGAIWSPDGKRIAYFTDEAGENDLVVRAPEGGEPRRVRVEPKPTVYGELTWSPDGRRLAFTDAHLNLWLCDPERGAAERVSTATHTDGSTLQHPAWSPDSRWLAYVQHGPNRVRSLRLYSLDRRRQFTVTDPRVDAQQPTFDQNGKYLYFIGSNQTGIVESQGMSVFPFRAGVERKIYAVVLDRATPPPTAPQAAEGQGAPASSVAASGATIDLTEIERRVMPLAVGVGNPGRLLAGRPGVLFVVEGATLHKWVVGGQQSEKFVEGAGLYRVTPDGSRLLLRRQGQWSIVPTDAPPKTEDGRFKLQPADFTLDPRAEWRLLYEEAWRRMRDFFYDPNLHGQDFAALRAYYAAYLPNVASRDDLNYVFKEMFSHLSSSHMGVLGGDRPAPAGAAAAESTGLLGADYGISQGRYRIRRILRGDPVLGLSAPLAQPGADAREGDYIISVDGEELKANENIYRRFVNKAGKPVQLTLSASPDGPPTRTLTVVPAANEYALRRHDWAERNRRRVAELSGGRLAYVYLSNTSEEGFNTFNREFYAQLDRQGLVLDARFNEGGRAADHVIDTLRRVPLQRARLRAGEDIRIPVGLIDGPKVLLTNEFSGSGGDTLPWMARRSRAATVVGQRTAGAGVGASNQDLLDGGVIRTPDWGWYDPQTGAWLVENHGAEVDVSVVNLPAGWRAGRDPQLERAVQIALDALKRTPVAPPRRPRFPVYK